MPAIPPLDACSFARRSSERRFAAGQPLSAELLYRRRDPAEPAFASWSELEEATGPIGQER